MRSMVSNSCAENWMYINILKYSEREIAVWHSYEIQIADWRFSTNWPLTSPEFLIRKYGIVRMSVRCSWCFSLPRSARSKIKLRKQVSLQDLYLIENSAYDAMSERIFAWEMLLIVFRKIGKLCLITLFARSTIIYTV